VLKLAGEWGYRPPLVAVAGLPAIDLAAGADALHEPLNRGYEWRFLRGLMARYARKVEIFPASLRLPADRPGALYPRVRWQDCGPLLAFPRCRRLLQPCRQRPGVDRIAVPTLILCAQDDPFIRLTPVTRAKLRANRHIELSRPATEATAPIYPGTGR